MATSVGTEAMAPASALGDYISVRLQQLSDDFARGFEVDWGLGFSGSRIETIAL